MKSTFWLFILLLSLISIPAKAQAEAIKLLQADESQAVLELVTPSFDIKEIIEADTSYHKLIISGFGKTFDPGYPQVPVGGSLVGVSNPKEVEIEVLETENETLSGYYLYPSPKLVIKEENGVKYPVEEFCLNEAVYSQNNFYPGQIVKLDETGYMRRQGVVRMLFYPVQFNPVTREIKIYNRIRVRVSWPTTAFAKMQIDQQKDPYGKLLKDTFINYKALPRGAELKSTSSDLSVQTPVSSPDPGYKIFIKEDGLYRITMLDLEATGGDLSGVDPATIKVFYLGQEIPIHVAGEEDGILDPDDYIEFYAQAINNKYTNTNVYWLSYGGANGLRLYEADGSPSGTGIIPSKYRTLLHLEESHTHWGALPNGAGKDLWYWGRIDVPPTSEYKDSLTVSFNLDQITTTGDCNITVILQGRTDTITDPDHHTRIYLNGVQIDDQWWDGQIEFIHQVTVPQSLLVNGTNTIKIYSVGKTGSNFDYIYLDWIEIEYDHLYAAESNALIFNGQVEDRYQYEVTNFSSSDIDLYDITDPHNVVRIVNTIIEPDDPGYKLIFQQEERAEPRKYLALTSGRRKSPTPKSIILDTASDLSNPGNGADYIIITYDNFYASVQPLADFRAQQGLRVITARLTDVYDEFNYGLSEPQAIQNFLKHAYQNWTGPPPTYVLLVGDTSYDYKDNLELGKVNYMPTYFLAASGMNETPSDNWYVCVSGDDFLPDMFVGRLSVRSAADATTVVNKIINYEQNPITDNWNHNVLLAADDEPEFENVSDHWAPLFPADYIINKVYLGDYDSPGQANADMKSYINNGSLVTNYTGHGNKTIWAGEPLFHILDIASLNNFDRLTWVVSFTCVDGYFTHPKEDYCLAEEFVRANNKGALAAFSSTGYGYSSEHLWLGEALYRTVFEDKNKILGAAGTIAKIKAYSQYGISGDCIKVYTLFGDPASSLKVVNQPPVLNVEQSIEVNEGDSLNFSVSATDSDPDDTIILSANDLPNGANFDTNTGKFHWIPDYDQAGLYEVTFIATDSWGDTDTKIVTITANNTNRLPVAQDLLMYTDEDNPVTIILSASDPDNDSLIFNIVTQPGYGNLSGTPPELTYNPNSGYSGTDSFTYKANDGQSNSNIAMVAINIICSTETYYRDEDGDGYGDPNNSIEVCSAPSGYVLDNTDCNDTNPLINQAEIELCDGIDNNCNDKIDEDITQTCETGLYGACAAGVQTCFTGSWGTCVQQNQPSEEICDGIDNDCDNETDEGCNTINIISLNNGWNLISLNLQPTNIAIGEVLRSVSDSCNSTWAFDNGLWMVYYPEYPEFSDLETMESGNGYWINMNKPAVLTVTGTTSSEAISLDEGWNLVGYNSSDSLPIADAIESIIGDCESIWAYIDGNWKVYYPKYPEFSDLQIMEPTYGYWIKTKRACIWTIPLKE